MREAFPPESQLPGIDGESVDVDYEAGATTLRFDVAEAMANQLGAVQGGVVATMLDGCIGIAGAVRSGGVLAMPLADVNVRSAGPSRREPSSAEESSSASGGRSGSSTARSSTSTPRCSHGLAAPPSRHLSLTLSRPADSLGTATLNAPDRNNARRPVAIE